MTVAVIVYDRIQNIKKWINCWRQSETGGHSLIIIHNYNGRDDIKNICETAGVKYVRRKNIGYDIGAMQDVFMERLDGFPNDWDFLLWCTDDVIPMRKDFVYQFYNSICASGGLSAMHISTEYSPHVRTGCFCISKFVSKKIIFPADPVVTKKECYYFEHRGGMMTLTNQIRLLGLDCFQVAPLQESPMYDTNYWLRNKNSIKFMRRYRRDAEHKRIFKHEL